MDWDVDSRGVNGEVRRQVSSLLLFSALSEEGLTFRTAFLDWWVATQEWVTELFESVFFKFECCGS